MAEPGDTGTPPGLGGPTFTESDRSRVWEPLLWDADVPRPAQAPTPEELAALPGGFAVAWRDPMGRTLFARDPVGTRSLYWTAPAGRSPAVGSRLGDVLAPGARRTLDRAALVAYLSTAYVPGERTLVEGVRSARPGVLVTLAPNGGIEAQLPFAELPASPANYAPEDALRARLRALLERVVTRMLPGGPVGAFLSGGIDSSLVVALARRLGAEVRALSVAFGPEHKDEVAWSRRVAQHVGAQHEVVLVRPEDVAARFDATVAALSEPNGDPLTVPNDRLFATARGHGLSAVLNGEGGDPCFGGPKNAPLLLAELYGHGDDAEAQDRAYLRAHQKLWDELDGVLTRNFASPADKAALLALVRPWLRSGRWPSYLDRLMALNVAWKGSAHILPKVEHLGALHGVRAQSPLFDWELVRLAFELPAELKRKGSEEKYLLKEAVADLLPESVLRRPKSGMMVPVEAWFSGPLEGFARERLLDGLARRDGFDRAWLERLLDRRLAGLRPRRGVKIWLLLTLESWLRQYDVRA